MGQNRKKNTDKIAIQSSTVPRVREWAKWANKRTSECIGGREQSEQSGASEWVSGASERVNGWGSGPVLQSVFFVVLAHSATVTSMKLPLRGKIILIQTRMSHFTVADFAGLSHSKNTVPDLMAFPPYSTRINWSAPSPSVGYSTRLHWLGPLLQCQIPFYSTRISWLVHLVYF